MLLLICLFRYSSDVRQRQDNASRHRPTDIRNAGGLNQQLVSVIKIKIFASKSKEPKG